MVFFTRRAMVALGELRQLCGDGSPSVFGMTTKTIIRRVKAAGLGEGFFVHTGRVARPDAPDSVVMRQGQWQC